MEHSKNDAITILFDKYANTLINNNLADGLPQQDAEDIVQKLFLGLLKSKTQLAPDDPETIKYLLKSNKNTRTDYYRSTSRRNKRIVPPEQFNIDTEGATIRDPSQNIDDYIDKLEEIGIIEQNFDRLNSVEKEILILRYNEELSTQDIAKRLDIKEGTVRSHLSRAISKMK